MKIPRVIYALSAIGAGVGAYVLIKTESNEQYLPLESTHGKTILVTGGTSGIGKFVVKDLAERGGRVVVGCRDMDKCIRMVSEDLKPPYKDKVVCKQLNLASLKSIRRFAEEFNANEEHLDLLVNNAGVVTKKRKVTEDGFEEIIGVNFLGKFLLTHLLLDKMKTTPGFSRIINLTCIGYHSGRINFDDFNSEKTFDTKRVVNMASLTTVLFTHKLAQMLEDSDSTVGVYTANPGLADTDLRRDMSTHNAFFSRHLLKPVWWAMFKSPKRASKTVLFCALHPHIGHPYSSGKLYYRSKEDRPPKQVYSQSIEDRLWDVAVHWTRLPEGLFTHNEYNDKMYKDKKNRDKLRVEMDAKVSKSDDGDGEKGGIGDNIEGTAVVS